MGRKPVTTLSCLVGAIAVISIVGCATVAFVRSNINPETRLIASLEDEKRLSVEVTPQLFAVPEREISASVLEGRNSRLQSVKAGDRYPVEKRSYPNDLFCWIVDLGPVRWPSGVSRIEFFRGERMVYDVEIEIGTEFVSPWDY